MSQKILITTFLIVLSNAYQVLKGDTKFNHSLVATVYPAPSIQTLTNGRYSCPKSYPYICALSESVSCEGNVSDNRFKQCRKLDEKFTFEEKHIYVFNSMQSAVSYPDHLTTQSPSKCFAITKDNFEKKYFNVDRLGPLGHIKIDREFTVNTVHYKRIFCDNKENFESELQYNHKEYRSPRREYREYEIDSPGNQTGCIIVIIVCVVVLLTGLGIAYVFCCEDDSEPEFPEFKQNIDFPYDTIEEQDNDEHHDMVKSEENNNNFVTVLKRNSSVTDNENDAPDSNIKKNEDARIKETEEEHENSKEQLNVAEKSIELVSEIITLEFSSDLENSKQSSNESDFIL